MKYDILIMAFVMLAFTACLFGVIGVMHIKGTLDNTARTAMTTLGLLFAVMVACAFFEYADRRSSRLMLPEATP